LEDYTAVICWSYMSPATCRFNVYSNNFKSKWEIGECRPCSCWSQWPRGLRRKCAATRLLRSWVRIPTGAWMFVCC
jgi:hypothetical protein